MIRYQKGDEYSLNELIHILVNNTNEITELSCEEMLHESDVEQICEVLRLPTATLETLHLPKNTLSINSVNRIAELLFTNTTITNLDLRHNGIGPKGLATLIQPLLSANTTLRVLCLKDNHLTQKSCSSIESLIRHCKSLEELHLGHNTISHRGIGHLAEEIIRSPHLKNLNLSHNHLGHKGMAKLAKELQAAPHEIEVLDLACNQAGDMGMQAIMGLLLHDKKIQKLGFASNDLGTSSGGMWCSILKHNYTLIELSLGGNQLGNEGVIDLATGLWENLSLVRLELNWNQIGDKGGRAIAEVLKKNGKLQILDLNGNKISRDGGVALAQALPYHLQLRELHLDYNRLEDEAAVEFAKALCLCDSTLKEILWANNSFTNKGLNALSRAMRYRTNCQEWLNKDILSIQKNQVPAINWLARSIGDTELEKLATTLLNTGTQQRLTCIYLGGTDITANGMERLCRWMKSCLCLKRFYLRKSRIGDEGAAQLGTVLKYNRSLEVLSITSSLITVKGAAEIADGLLKNSTLTRLNLGNNLLRDEGCIVIFRALSANTTLESLNLMSNEIRGMKKSIWEELVSIHASEVDLNDNLLTDKCIGEFIIALMGNCPFTILDLSGNKFTSKGAQVLSKCIPLQQGSIIESIKI